MTESMNTVDLMQRYTRCTYVQDVRVRCRTPIIPNLVNVATSLTVLLISMLLLYEDLTSSVK